MVRILVATMVATVNGHGWLTEPPSRTGATMAAAGLCPYGSCLWFNQGCTIGCPECGGIDGSSTCGALQGKPTLPQSMRTYNVGNENCGTNPWCAPGSSPMLDPCGVSAGGDKQGSAGNGNDNPPGYKYGDRGSEMRDGADEHRSWQIGAAVEVAWAVTANHGGGYQYRLCSKSSAQTEECFQANPLEFVGDEQWIQYANVLGSPYLNLTPDQQASVTPDGFNHSLKLPPSKAFNKIDLSARTAYPAQTISEGTLPKGSQWRRNPIPACNNGLGGSFNYGCHVSSIPGRYPAPNSSDFQFAPPGEDLARPGLLLGGFGEGACGGCAQPKGNNPPDCNKYGKLGRNSCDADETSAQFFNFNILDKVRVPNVPAGEYVLSFRWDCEQTPQIWSQCSDVTIVAADAMV